MDVRSLGWDECTPKGPDSLNNIKQILLLSPGRFPNKVFCNQILMRLGRIASGTYLLHYLCINAIFFVLLRYTTLSPGAIYLGRPLVGVAGAVAVAGISWHIFEKPLIERAQIYKY